MDGTFLVGDSLVELFVAGVFRRPLPTLGALGRLVEGRPAFKAALAANIDLCMADAPVRRDLLTYLQDQKREGRPVYLVSAADQRVVDHVAAGAGIFDGAFGSSAGINLKGIRKADFLKDRFPGGFAYAGDSRADLPVWSEAAGVVIVGGSDGVAARARALGRPVEAEFPAGRRTVALWLRALRAHQWAKNILIFIPLILSVHAHSLRHIGASVIGFAVLSLAASATYILNDLVDLNSDRQHRSKRARPLASGALPLGAAALAVPLLLLLSLLGAAALNAGVFVALLGYLALTLSYSLRLKRTPLLDVIVLAGLYTMRLVMGTILAGVEFSAWLLTFAGFFFFAMSLAKRHVEVTAARDWPADLDLPGRGYRPGDAPLTLALGVSASVASVLIVVQYMMAEAFPSGVYARPAWLWAAPVLLSVWICRVWFLAHRGELHDDPVEFAIKDPASLGLGALLALTFVIARL